MARKIEPLLSTAKARRQMRYRGFAPTKLAMVLTAEVPTKKKKAPHVAAKIEKVDPTLDKYLEPNKTDLSLKGGQVLLYRKLPLTQHLGFKLDVLV